MANCAADKEALQKTLSVFDSDIEVGEVVGYSSKYESRNQSTDVWFLQTVLEVCCSFVEPNPAVRKRLFKVLESLLVREKIIPSNIRFESLADIRRKSAKQFIVSLNELRSSIIPSPKDAITTRQILDAPAYPRYPDTYGENFEEVCLIAEGGFGTVCMARHKVDGLIYAIKKIIFNYEREKDFTQVMSEVNSISTLSHKNIVSYKNCWIQMPNSLDERSSLADEYSSESLDSISQKFSSSSRRQKKRKPKFTTILNFNPTAHSSPCSEHTKGTSAERNLLERDLNLTRKKRVSFNIPSNRTRLSSISESDQSSIVCDFPSLAQDSVLTDQALADNLSSIAEIDQIPGANLSSIPKIDQSCIVWGLPSFAEDSILADQTLTDNLFSIEEIDQIPGANLSSIPKIDQIPGANLSSIPKIDQSGIVSDFQSLAQDSVLADQTLADNLSSLAEIDQIPGANLSSIPKIDQSSTVCGPPSFAQDSVLADQTLADNLSSIAEIDRIPGANLSSISKIDQSSIVSNFQSLAQDSVPADQTLADNLPSIAEIDQSFTHDSVQSTDSQRSNSSSESWLSNSEFDMSLDSERRHDHFWNSSSSSSPESACGNINNRNSLSSIPEEELSRDRMSLELKTNKSVIYSDSYRTNSLCHPVPLLDAHDSTLSDSCNATLLTEGEDLDSEEEETASETGSVESVVFQKSLKNDSTFTKHSVLTNGDFNRNITVSRSQTSSSSSWCVNSKMNQTQSGSSDDSSIVCYNPSSKVLPLEYPFQFKIKFQAMLCIQMEYCDCDLRLWLDQRANGDLLPFQKEVKDIFKEIVKGVSYIHSKSIIHRDLKPQNIFYSEKDNSMKIGDFGLATLGHSSPNRHRIVNQRFTSNLGTYPYAAPEQRKKHVYDEKVDIYSLGMILIELLVPFRTNSEFFHTIPQIVSGHMPQELTSQWPAYVDLVTNLVETKPSLRMTALEILNLPIMEDDAEVNRRLLISEIESLKKALEDKDGEYKEALKDKDREYKEALKEKDAIIESLRSEIRELSAVTNKLKSKKSKKKH